MKKNRMRRKGTGRRIDVSSIREVLRDERGWIEIAVVVKDGDSHFDIEDGAVYVDVELLPEETPMRCNLMSIAGGPGDGIWRVPDIGTVVVVAIPGGDVVGGGIILGTLSTRNVPEGVSTGKTVIVAPEVLVYDTASGDAKELAYKSDVQAVRDAISGATIVPADGGASMKATIELALAGITPPTGISIPQGTSILKAK